MTQRRGNRWLYVALALASGAPALVYEVVWTREVALLVGAEVEATSLVLAAFFGGLALGARWLGAWADRARSPLRLYAWLEGAGALLAIHASIVLRALGTSSLFGSSQLLLLLLCVGLLLVTALPLGGALPALLRAAEAKPARAPRTGGVLVGANTAGAALGVFAAAVGIPTVGLRATLLTASAVQLAIGLLAWLASRPAARPASAGVAPAHASSGRLPGWPLAVAALAGVATLAYEVLIARMSAIALGSSLFAWTTVLALFLLGLALGNLLAGRRAASSPQPDRDLAWIECAAAAAIALGALLLAPGVAVRGAGPTPATLLALAVSVFPAALAMGGAFPFFVRLIVGRRDDLARAFGSASAANTAGGVVGSLLASFLLLPWLGLVGGALACAALNGAIACALLVHRARAAEGVRSARGVQATVPVLLVAVLAVIALAPPAVPPGMRVIFVAEGRQATASVLHNGDRRDLIVNGDAQASTAGSARRTEELLALLPLLIHPDAKRFLEVGFGSGITLGLAAQFPLERIDCAEIAASVLAAARFFQPDNRFVTSGRDPRLRIVHADGRAFAARQRAQYDVVVANTIFPGSIGATGLYSREYFSRIASSLRAGGIAVQWLPLERLGADSLAAILRTFYAVYPHGSLWWGAENVIALGSQSELPELRADRFETLQKGVSRALWRSGISQAAELSARRLASAHSVRAVLGEEPVLQDDRPLLELLALSATRAAPMAKELALLEQIARAGAADDPRAGLILLFVEARAARAQGKPDQADRLEQIAEGAGLELARLARAERATADAARALQSGDTEEARRGFETALAVWPGLPDALFALAVIAVEAGDFARASATLEPLVEVAPDSAKAWNLLGVSRLQQGDAQGAQRAFEAALEADPFLLEALANAGLALSREGERAAALALLARLHELGVTGPSAEEIALAEALGEPALPRGR